MVGMEEISWKTVFKGKLIVRFDNKDQVEVFPCGGENGQQLCVFVMQAVRRLRNEFLSGAEVAKNWEMTSFSPEKRILEIQKIKA